MTDRQAESTNTALAAVGVVYFGMSGQYSVPPLEALLVAGITVRAVVIPALAALPGGGIAAPYVLRPPARTARAPRAALPLLGPQPAANIAQIAAAHGIPVLEVARLRDPVTLTAFAAFAPDIMCVACFSRRLPPALLRMPRLGCLNVHPSLLPDNRGPDPLFWTFRRGDAATGVTIHRMDDGLDTGPILAQRQIAVSDGITEAALERRCATLGGELLVSAVEALARGAARPVPQDEGAATIYPWPDAADFAITPEWPARRAYNFACGLLARQQPITIVTPGATFRLVAPLTYTSDPAAFDAPFHLDGDILHLRCSTGVFIARVALE
jgi:methionyl-tRNA formyltransferase